MVGGSEGDNDETSCIDSIRNGPRVDIGKSRNIDIMVLVLFTLTIDLSSIVAPAISVVSVSLDPVCAVVELSPPDDPEPKSA